MLLGEKKGTGSPHKEVFIEYCLGSAMQIIRQGLTIEIETRSIIKDQILGFVLILKTKKTGGLQESQNTSEWRFIGHMPTRKTKYTVR